MINVQRNNERIELTGALDHVSVASVLAQSTDWFATKTLNISLQGINQSNSAGVALLLEWQKIARQKNVSLQLHAVPEQLRVIARAYGVDELLKLSSNQ